VTVAQSDGVERAVAIKAALAKAAREQGFDVLGVTGPDSIPLAPQRLAEFLAEGAHGEMGWLEANATGRSAPAVFWPPVRSVIMLGLNYGRDNDPLATLQQRERGTISVYAQSTDYHDIMKPRLKALAAWLIAAAGGEAKVFVDTAAVMEKPRGPAGRASTPTLSRVSLVPGCSSAPSSRRSICPATNRPKIAAEAVERVWIFVRRGHSQRLIDWMRADASPISRLSTKDRYRGRCALPWGIASMAATTVLQCAPGTNSLVQPVTASSRSARSCTRQVSPICLIWTMLRFEICSQRHRSNGPEGAVFCVMC
jgi:hypothetical protein